MSKLKHRKLTLKNIQNISLSYISSTFFWLVSLKREHEILSTKGSVAYGGRYNPPGGFGVLYLSGSLEVCYAERERKAKKDTLLAQVAGKIKVSFKKVLDLTNPKILKKLGLKEEDLKKERHEDGWGLTQNIARLAYQCGIEAILAPSITGKGNNLIGFDKYLNDATAKVLSKTKD